MAGLASLGAAAMLSVAVRSAAGGQWSRRRAGFQFGREPVLLQPEDLGEGLAAMFRLAAICEDPRLRVVLINGEDEHEIGPEELAELNTWLEAEQAKVDPANPHAVVTNALAGMGPESTGVFVPQIPAFDAPTDVVGDAGAVDAGEPGADGQASDAAPADAAGDAGAVANEKTEDAPAAGGNTRRRKPAAQA